MPIAAPLFSIPTLMLGDALTVAPAVPPIGAQPAAVSFAALLADLPTDLAPVMTAPTLRQPAAGDGKVVPVTPGDPPPRQSFAADIGIVELVMPDIEQAHPPESDGLWAALAPADRERDDTPDQTLPLYWLAAPAPAPPAPWPEPALVPAARPVPSASGNVRAVPIGNLPQAAAAGVVVPSGQPALLLPTTAVPAAAVPAAAGQTTPGPTTPVPNTPVPNTPIPAGTVPALPLAEADAPLTPLAALNPAATPARQLSPASSSVIAAPVPDRTRSEVAVASTVMPTAPATVPVSATAAPTTPAAIIQSAAALQQAAVQRTERTSQSRDSIAPSFPDLTPSAIAPSIVQPAAPVAAPQQAAMDLRQDTGLHRMIDRIETLRDAADESDTRIRLYPDALGRVDIAVRREGDGVRVHFTAAESGTRQLLAEAQPRLSELADSRGVRIERATVDAGGTHTGDAQAGDHQRSPFAAPPAVPARPRTPTSVAEAATDPISDIRIA